MLLKSINAHESYENNTVHIVDAGYRSRARESMGPHAAKVRWQTQHVPHMDVALCHPRRPHRLDSEDQEASQEVVASS